MILSTAVVIAQSASEVVWRLQTQWSWAPWATFVFVALAIATVATCYRFETTPAGTTYRSGLSLLRLVTIALILVMLSEAVFSGSRSGKPRLAVLLDRSASMLRDDADESGSTRLNAANQLLTDDNAQLLHELQQSYQIDLTYVDGLVAEEATGAEAIAESITNTNKNNPSDDTTTRLGDAITGLLDSPPDAPLQGILLLSDGQVTAGKSLADAAESARRSGVPIYAIGFGQDTAPPEARLSDLVADDTAFVDDLVAFRATLSTRGLTGKSVRVDLMREGSSTPVATQTINATDAATEVRLVDRPTSPGEFRYKLRTTVTDTSVPSSEANHTLRVRDDQIRVLLAAGYPNYEYRYLKHLLERDETIRVGTYLQEADPEYVESDLTALPRMPLRLEAIAEYDALVLIDLDPTLLPRSLWNEVSKFVSERGGGVVLVAGPRNLPGAYRSRSAFVAMAPTEIQDSAFGGWQEPNGYRVLPTELGQQASPLELGDSAGDTESIWRSLPTMYWRSDVGPPKPAAQVLAAHPTARLAAGVPAPLIVSHYYGAGRVLLHAFDATYRWRFRVGDIYFARYWVQTLRSLARNKRLESATSLELTADKRRYEPGDAIRLRLRDERPVRRSQDTPAQVVLQSPGKADRTIELNPGASGRFEATLRRLAPGKYRALLADSGAAPAIAEFEVIAPLSEEARPEMNRKGLTAATDRTRGTFLTLEEADRLGELIPPGRPTALESLPPYELWNRWPLLAAITGCLCLEWILRKKRAML